MKESRESINKETGMFAGTAARGTPVRLLVVPVLVYLVWVVETYLFDGQAQLFSDPGTASLLLYTLMTCVLIGLVAPVILIRRAFVTGDVNMHQIGFRPLRRTFLMVVLTAVIIWAAVILHNPFGTDRFAFVVLFLQFIPTGIAMVMTCWVLIGTHIQAYVRDGGVYLSITLGVILTGILFALAAFALYPGVREAGALVPFLSLGFLAAIFFFAVRDVWAASIAVTGALVWLMAGQVDAPPLITAVPVISAAAALAIGVLAFVHWHLYRHYVTIPAPVS